MCCDNITHCAGLNVLFPCEPPQYLLSRGLSGWILWREIEIWATNDEEVSKNADSYEGWELISAFESQKPSGNGADVDPTPEDIEHAKAGEEYEMPLEAGSYRYIRFRTIETWGKTDRSWLAELEWYGQVENE